MISDGTNMFRILIALLAALCFTAPLCAAEQQQSKVAADDVRSGRFGGVKRAPRGNSMGQMGQRVRHG
jgi:hypothetical protein